VSIEIQHWPDDQPAPIGALIRLREGAEPEARLIEFTRPDLRATVHFETATLGFGFECDPGACDRNGNPLRGTTVVREVVILRGLRVE
jgi:hypothetical protein